jgi:hypothetical protein
MGTRANVGTDRNEHRTSNVQHRILNEKDGEIEELIRFSLRVPKRPFDRLTALSGVEGLKRNRDSHFRLDIGFVKRNEIDCGAERHHDSMFDVGRSMFDVQSVRCSTFIFQNNFAMMQGQSKSISFALCPLPCALRQEPFPYSQIHQTCFFDLP